MSLWSERCFIVASWQSQRHSVKTKKNEKSKALEMVNDQTQLRSKTFVIRPICARTVYDQTQLLSSALLIRANCARTVYDQTQVRSNMPMIRLFRPNWTLNRPTPDHGPDCSALKNSVQTLWLRSGNTRVCAQLGPIMKQFRSAPQPCSLLALFI